jgi:glycosyltransferase involved in cell wall biosynthesis
MSTPSISIAMTTFNGALYLSEQLTSLSSQTLKPMELVVCDDGSTDETVSILRAFSDVAPFKVRIFENAERLGYQQNFMKAASLCTGSLIAFCDQDDVWDNNKLRVVANYFVHSDHLAISHDLCVFFEDGGKLIPSYFRHLALSGLSPVVNIKGCSLILSRELIELVHWPATQSNYSHDTWVCFTALLLGRRGYIKKPLVRHRIHRNNTSGKLAGGDARLHRLLRRLQLPPFTSTADLDVFIGASVGPGDIRFYGEAVRQCASAMTDSQRQRALCGLARRRAICDFVISEAYGHPVQRAINGLALFLKRAYRDSDGIHGLVQDILGRRNWMRHCSESTRMESSADYKALFK